MRRLGLSKAIVWLAILPAAAPGQDWLTQEGDLWVRTIRQTADARPRLRIISHGPVTLEGNAAERFEYTVKVAVRARSREEARMLLERAAVRPEVQAKACFNDFHGPLDLRLQHGGIRRTHGSRGERPCKWHRMAHQRHSTYSGRGIQGYLMMEKLHGN